jgi:pyruvate/2-oxoglutarate dehydrogenase complex dihydrolipoamide dehydrogenase (E3) component
VRQNVVAVRTGKEGDWIPVDGNGSYFPPCSADDSATDPVGMEQCGLYVLTDAGKVIGCDFVISATGVTPCVDFAGMIGLRTNDEGAIIVDEEMQSNIPGIFAAGDCCSYRPEREGISEAIGESVGASALEDIEKSTWYQMKLWSQVERCLLPLMCVGRTSCFIAACSCTMITIV